MTLLIKLRNDGFQIASTTIQVSDPLRSTDEILKAIAREKWMLAEGDTIIIEAAE